MANNIEQVHGEPEESREREALLDILESAFEKQAKVELTVLEPSGQPRTSEVVITGLEEGTLFVSDSPEGAVMGIPVADIKNVKLVEE